MTTMMNIGSVNPNILFGGMLALVVLSGLGEYLHIVPSGTTSVMIGAVFGGGVAHASYAMGSNTATQAAAVQAQAQTPTTGDKAP